MAAAAAAGGKQSKPAWLWCPTSGGLDASKFHHPGEIPQDAEVADAHFTGGCRGPRLARLNPVQLLSVKTSKPQMCMVAFQGAMLEVSRFRLLPWHEGLLIIQELLKDEGIDNGSRLNAPWVDSDLRAALDKARKNNLPLGSAKYVEERLMGTAITGATYVDEKSREWSFRRDTVLTNAEEEVEFSEQTGDTDDGLYGIEKICGYMPPWEALCHPKCGYYQDFYQVLWSYPYSKIDYAQVENGCLDLIGATWEPDECIPSYFDKERVQAKRAWHAKQLTLESGAKNTPGKLEPASEPAVKKRRTRRDGEPLAKDITQGELGHDFVRVTDDASFDTVRVGWPRTADQYPKGFSVASPPGFCAESCDCMDDQRAQHKWEMKKGWIEDPSRTAAAISAVEAFGKEKSFVKRRGEGNSICYFETLETYMYRSLQPLAKAALDIATYFQDALKQVCLTIPLRSLTPGNEPICLPSSAFIPEAQAYCPLQVLGHLESGGELPSWLVLDMTTGHMSAKHALAVSDIRVRIQFKITASLAHEFTCTISCTTAARGLDTPWCKAMGPLMEKFINVISTIDTGLKAVLQEHLAKIYDFRTRTARDVSLKLCVDILSRCLRMLRATSVANLTLTVRGRN